MWITPRSALWRREAYIKGRIERLNVEYSAIELASTGPSWTSMSTAARRSRNQEDEALMGEGRPGGRGGVKVGGILYET